MDNMKHRRLQELDRSDFEIVKGEPDIRGWDVKNSRGQKIGEVEDLVVDARQKKVRYMVVDLDDNELDLDERKVLIPIGLAELDQKDDDVILPRVQAEQLRGLPVYDKDHLDAAVERRVCSTLGRTESTARWTEGMEPEPEFYKHDYFNDDNLYRHRLRENIGSMNRESDFERGLRLWERRSEGGIIASGDAGARSANRKRSREEEYHEREIDEKARMEMVRNRRSHYEQRRNRTRDMGREDDRSSQRDNSVERRIRDEGLQDRDMIL
jgi:sporulation protein YlmC with PRC-barrel domain